MKKKYVKEVFMREVESGLFYVEECPDIDGIVGIKYIQRMNEPVKTLCNGREYVWLDNGYSILEFVPRGRGYNCRIFFDAENVPLLYYFDVNDGVGVDERGVWYNDLYLDVVCEMPKITRGCMQVRLDDRQDFEDAYQAGLFDEKTYARGFDTAKQIMGEISCGANDCVGRSLHDLMRLKTKLGITADFIAQSDAIEK